jgi:transposase
MAKLIIFPIKETVNEIKRLQRTATPIISKRLGVLLAFKRYEIEGISKRALSAETGCDANSVRTWRNLYIKGGIEALMGHNNKGYKPNQINSEQESDLRTILNDPENGFVGYIELQSWFNEKYKMEVEYHTFRSFIIRKFQSKIKVARKSHVQKSQQAVDTFKKTSIKSAKKSLKKKVKSSKK